MNPGKAALSLGIDAPRTSPSLPGPCGLLQTRQFWEKSSLCGLYEFWDFLPFFPLSDKRDSASFIERKTLSHEKDALTTRSKANLIMRRSAGFLVIAWSRPMSREWA